MSFNQLCFSILFEEKKAIISRLGDLFFDRKKLNNIRLESHKTKMIEWIDPQYGKMTNFFIGSGEEIDYSIFMSNAPDGWMSMAHILSRKAGCKCIQIRISNKAESGIFEYEVIQNGDTVRIVQLIQDPKWKFFTKGDPLPYEDVSAYENRLMKNKFNVEIIKAYLKAVSS